MYNVDIGRHQIACKQAEAKISSFKYWLVGPAPAPSSPPASSSASASSHLAAGSSGAAPLASIAHASSIASIPHLSAIPIAIISISSITVGVHAITTIAPVASSAAAATSATSPASLVLGRDLLDGEGVAIDGGLALLHQLLGRLLPLECDEGEVLWLVVLALVHRPHHLGHGTEGDEVGLNLLVSDALGGKVAQGDLALLCLGLFTGDLLPLDYMCVLSSGGLYSSAVFEQNEGEAPGPSSVRVSL